VNTSELDRKASVFANERMTKLVQESDSPHGMKKAIWEAMVDGFRRGFAEGVASASRRETPPEDGEKK
jgi:hypothetical protein